MRPSIKNKTGHKLRSKGGLRYSTKDYVNPFFKKRPQRSRQSRRAPATVKTKVISFAILALLTTAIWLFFYSPYFEIKKVELNGGGRIDTKIIEDIAWRQVKDNFLLVFPQKNIFLFNKNRLLAQLEQKYSFDHIGINRKLPNTLIVEYSEKMYALIWQEENDFYYIDQTGGVIDNANLLEIEYKDYPIVENRTSKRIYEDQITLSQENIDYILSLFNELKEYQELLKVERYIVDNEQRTIKVKILNGPEIYFNVQEDITRQLKKVLIIKNEKLQDDFNEKTYIDVRYGESVYYR